MDRHNRHMLQIYIFYSKIFKISFNLFDYCSEELAIKMGKCVSSSRPAKTQIPRQKPIDQPKHNKDDILKKSFLGINFNDQKAMDKETKPTVSAKIEQRLKQNEEYNFTFGLDTDWRQLSPDEFQITGNLYAICDSLKNKHDKLENKSIVYYFGPNKQQFLIAGIFKNGKICQQGKERYLKIFPNGSIYIGELNNKFEQNGYGKYVNSNNTEEYEGYFNDGIPHGKGKKKKQGKQFEGVFRNGEITEGIQRTDKGWYKGSFSSFKKHGRGQLNLNNGYRYVGEFKNGNKQGYGIFYKDNEIQYEGQWRNDIRVKS